MEHINPNEISEIILRVIRRVTDDYAREIAEDETFINLVREDVEASSDWQEDGYWNEYDVVLAIGRTIIKLLNERKETI